MKSEEKQYDLFNKQENTSTLKSPSMESTRQDEHGTIPTDKQKKRRQRKLDLIEYKGGKCERCDTEHHPAAYDFHHIDPTQKSFTLHSGNLDMKWCRLLAEADKCALLCSCCHRIIHYENDLQFN